jgi:eukaryotic-like serine/threonine-protein kinase
LSMITTNLTIGTIFDGRYQIDALLGQGRTGVVYRARHTLLRDLVAIKILLPEIQARFLRENIAVERLTHTNAVALFDLYTTPDGLIYMVLEYVEGRRLEEELKRRGRFSPAEAFSVLKPIADMLDAAHARGIVHLNLNPREIILRGFVGGNLTVKLLDLYENLLLRSSDIEITNPENAFYRSPEHWEMRPDIDGRADIFSLGAIFYELVAGYRPTRRTALLELADRQKTFTPPPLHEFMPDVPVAFSRAIARAISIDRNERQVTAREFADELQAALQAERMDEPEESALAGQQAVPEPTLFPEDATAVSSPAHKETNCPACNSVNDAIWLYCQHCGQQLHNEERKQSGEPTVRPPSFVASSEADRKEDEPIESMLACLNCNSVNRLGSNFCAVCGVPVDNMSMRPNVLPRLRVIQDDGLGESYDLDSDETVIGRISGDICFPKDDYMSGRHARIIRLGKYFILIDDSSRNGIFVNNKRLLPKKQYLLNPGDVIRLGKTSLEFFIPEPVDKPEDSQRKADEGRIN